MPGGVTLLAEDGEDAGRVQTIGARFAHGQITLEEAAEIGCRACASPGGGCQFLGTAATSQVVAEALGMSLAALGAGALGHPIWLDMARRSARAVLQMEASGFAMKRRVDTDVAAERHGGACGFRRIDEPDAASCRRWPMRPVASGRPSADWSAVNRQVPRTGRRAAEWAENHPTVQVFLAGGVPEVMLHLRDAGLLNLNALNSRRAEPWSMLDWWEGRSGVRASG